ncbi:class I SAM-dependent methyltransferase [Vermiphilus pyriformis]|nr:MAG: class I SAM-dependent methyltransferase [Vermiphilus pyriformis]
MKFFKVVICSSVLCYQVPSLGTNLNQLGVKYNTDKSSIHHNYLDIYERYLNHLKDQPITFLEIGFLQGSSARMWDEYFSNGKLHFMDYDPGIYNYAHGLSDRSTLHIVDQGKRTDLENFIKKTDTQFDVILDDGGHRMEQQILSFEMLFPRIKPGGMYIVEDLHTSYWSDWSGYEFAKNTCNNKIAINYLLNLVHDVNHVGAQNKCADINKFPTELRKALNIYQSDIESIHFYTSICIIVKRK